MASERQLAANRLNAQKCTGPKTEEGKQRSSMNSLKHGLTAKVIVLPHEDNIEFHEIRAALLQSYQPANPHETMLVDQIAAGYWRTIRARRFETGMLSDAARTYKHNHGQDEEPNAGHDDSVCAVWMIETPEKALKNYFRYDGSIERQYYRAMAALDRVQAARFRRQDKEEQKLAKMLAEAPADTFAEISPEPPPPRAIPLIAQVSENGIGSVSSLPQKHQVGQALSPAVSSLPHKRQVGQTLSSAEAAPGNRFPDKVVEIS